MCKFTFKSCTKLFLQTGIGIIGKRRINHLWMLSAAKRLLIRLHDENGDEMFALSDSEGVSHYQPVDPDQSRTATLHEKLEGAIKKEAECIPKTAQFERLAGA